MARPDHAGYALYVTRSFACRWPAHPKVILSEAWLLDASDASRSISWHRFSLELKSSRRWRSDARSRRPPGWHDDAKSLNGKRTLLYQTAVFLPCSYANCGKNASDGERVGQITTGDIAFIFLRRTLGGDNNPVETKRFRVRIKKPLIR